MSATLHDEIGLVRAIAVKERSSAKHKEIFEGLQVNPQRKGNSDHVDIHVVVGKQLVLDMKHVDAFVINISYDAATAEKHAKIPCGESPAGVLFGDYPFLHCVIPALEVLYHAWSERSAMPANTNYPAALNKAAEKIDQYYQRTSRSTIQVMAMVLNPAQKGHYFEKHWGSMLAKEARETAEKIFVERWCKLNSKGATSKPAARRTSSCSRLLREITPESDDDEPSSSTHHRDPM
ncbi:hypothetical protein B0H10DRAFT_1953260 [Mycena sp. CBHHK59/15]|nr:hypothetical protein B0H10DRAFT_1953260 [Mycena sp. CBHHK59/15]